MTTIGEPCGLKGFSRPVPVVDVIAIDGNRHNKGDDESDNQKGQGNSDDRAVTRRPTRTTEAPARRPGSADPARRRFVALQARMESVWAGVKQDLDGRVRGGGAVGHGREEASPTSGAINQAFEERLLFLLLLLRQPRLRMVYVTSMPVNPRIVEYYLALLPGSFRATRWRG